MNTEERAALAAIWEDKRRDLADAKHAEDYEISAKCYVSFGTYGAAFCKFRQGRWQCKIVNNWRSLSFPEFLEKFEEAEWEKMH